MGSGNAGPTSLEPSPGGSLLYLPGPHRQHGFETPTLGSLGSRTSVWGGAQKVELMTINMSDDDTDGKKGEEEKTGRRMADIY